MAEPGLLIPRPEPLHYTRLLLTGGQFGGDKGKKCSWSGVGECDIVIYNKKGIFHLCPVPGTEFANPWNFLTDERNKDVFCYVIEGTFRIKMSFVTLLK